MFIYKKNAAQEIAEISSANERVRTTSVSNKSLCQCANQRIDSRAIPELLTFVSVTKYRLKGSRLIANSLQK